MEITALADTITIFVSDTLNQSDLIDPYKALIETQRETYNIIITVFLGILAIIGSAVGFFYFRRRTDYIKNITKEAFAGEKEDMLKSIKEEYEKEIDKLEKEHTLKYIEMEATNARHFAITIEDSQSANKMVWWFISLENYIKIGQGFFISIAVQEIKDICELLNKDIKLKNKFIIDCKNSQIDNKLYSYEYFFEILKKIPDTLTRNRNEIRPFFDSIKDEISLEVKEEKTKPPKKKSK